VREELAAVDKVHDEVELVGRLERHVQRHEKRVAHLLQNAALGLDVLGVVLLDNDLLVHDLHGIDAFGVLLGDLNHFAERALANHFEQIKVLQTDLVHWLAVKVLAVASRTFIYCTRKHFQPLVHLGIVLTDEVVCAWGGNQCELELIIPQKKESDIRIFLERSNMPFCLFGHISPLCFLVPKPFSRKKKKKKKKKKNHKRKNENHWLIALTCGV
jgi:hypothetical protein